MRSAPSANLRNAARTLCQLENEKGSELDPENFARFHDLTFQISRHPVGKIWVRLLERKPHILRKGVWHKIFEMTSEPTKQWRDLPLILKKWKEPKCHKLGKWGWEVWKEKPKWTWNVSKTKFSKWKMNPPKIQGRPTNFEDVFEDWKNKQFIPSQIEPTVQWRFNN
jgi:hypothetical protein